VPKARIKHDYKYTQKNNKKKNRLLRTTTWLPLVVLTIFAIAIPLWQKNKETIQVKIPQKPPNQTVVVSDLVITG
jgi:hypothetical protein